MGRQWPRCVTVLVQILKFNDPIVGVYKEGITFSTYRKPSDGQKEPTIKKIPVDGIHHGPPIRAWNLEVPMYSGQEAFTLTSYPKLARAEEFGVDSFVLVVFTVGGYRTRNDSERVSLNVQFVIGLEDQLPRDVGDVTDEILSEFGDETPIGVDDVTPMKLASESFEPVDVTAIPGGPMM
ncbi:hypothetical protein EDD85DRAFT_793767 [Armillaria nabsnona]|nr:hypothetical protein EDD85DRAFT_793767 [Armillaria nabsnona]